MADSKVEKGKWFKFGAIKKGRTGSQYLQVGNPKDKYQPVNVEITIKSLDGTVLSSAVNPNLVISNPRKRPNVTEEQLERIPEWLLADVSLAPPKES